ncbi:hypothetical protein FQA47_015654 [Oryzias melastigma]|uniref:Uncharacterized protein n=1 Tax=Oryzias melastigma TaxID=30732 RepID=A0A834C6P2_ORYME|nr:hypothetical protein FQA47_015654 [Oryzias melastigma]
MKLWKYSEEERATSRAGVVRRNRDSEEKTSGKMRPPNRRSRGLLTLLISTAGLQELSMLTHAGFRPLEAAGNLLLRPDQHNKRAFNQQKTNSFVSAHPPPPPSPGTSSVGSNNPEVLTEVTECIKPLITLKDNTSSNLAAGYACITCYLRRSPEPEELRKPAGAKGSGPLSCITHGMLPTVYTHGNASYRLQEPNVGPLVGSAPALTGGRQGPRRRGGLRIRRNSEGEGKDGRGEEEQERRGNEGRRRGARRSLTSDRREERRQEFRSESGRKSGGEERFGSSPARGSVSYSSLSHLSVAETDPGLTPIRQLFRGLRVPAPCPAQQSRGTTCPRCKAAHKERLCRAATHGIPCSSPHFSRGGVDPNPSGAELAPSPPGSCAPARPAVGSVVTIVAGFCAQLRLFLRGCRKGQSCLCPRGPRPRSKSPVHEPQTLQLRGSVCLRATVRATASPAPLLSPTSLPELLAPKHEAEPRRDWNGIDLQSTHDHW